MKITPKQLQIVYDVFKDTCSLEILDKVKEEASWRIKDIIDMLTTAHSYGLDEWSPPIKDLKALDTLITELDNHRIPVIK